MKNFARVISLLLFFSLLLGCTTKQYQLSEDRFIAAGQGAVLKVPARLQVMAVNGQAVPKLSSKILMSDAEVVLPEGVHEIKVRYRDLWDVGSEDHKKVTSRPLFLNLKAQTNKTYELTFNQPDSLSSAKRFADNPKFMIVESNSNAMISAPSEKQQMRQAAYQQRNRPIQMDNSFSNEEASMLEADPAPVSPKGKVVASTSRMVSQQRSAFNNLKEWWDKATPEERAEFQRWVWAKPAR